MKPFYFLFIILSTLLTSCSKDNHESHDEELITTLQLHFAPVNGGQTLSYAFRDADGPGGNLPILDDIVLDANSSYHLTIEVLNESVSPAINITNEISSEATSHRFYYIPSQNMNINNLNTDANDVPVGLTADVETLQPYSGTFRVVLRHYPGIPPNKEMNDPLESSKSVSDIDVTFSLILQ